MQPHRNAGTGLTPPRANTPPPAGNVHGLGLVDALRIELQPAQLPWLTAEIDIVRYRLEDEIEHVRARHDELPEVAKKDRWPSAREAEEELDRRAYQLQILAMVGEQLPISGEAAAAATTSPWREPDDDDAPELECVEEPVAAVAPAALMTVLIRGATRHVTEALGEALRGPCLDVDEHTDSGSGWRGPELPRVTPAIAEKLRAMAEAARAFTDTYLHVLAHQTYSFDPGYDPIHADEHEVAVTEHNTMPATARGSSGAAGNS
jgi:hypothetical protein